MASVGDGFLWLRAGKVVMRANVEEFDRSYTGRDRASRRKINCVKPLKLFSGGHNERAKPFRWRKREVKGSQLRNTVVNLRN